MSARRTATVASVALFVARAASRPITIMLMVAALAACASPSTRVHELATQGGLTRSEIPGQGFVHVAYYRAIAGAAARIHIYVEHDGLPWATATRMSDDPTPRDPLVLRLAIQDPAPVIYLGRPCYLGMARSPPCTPLIWTHQRYSEQVINSMAAALQTIRGESRSELVFLGHSGGGTLAWLLARRFANTRAVVTVAGNMDVRAWAALHGYTPLTDSLSPAESPDLPPRVLQMHYAGSLDTVIPAGLTQDFVSQRPGGVLVEYPGFDHRCCWERIWPAVLNDIESRIANSSLQKVSRPAAGESVYAGQVSGQ